MGAIRIEKDNDAARLVAEGRLTIQDASELKGLLLEALQAGGTLLVDLTRVESLDLACAQVFCSANDTYRDAQMTIRITGVLPEGVVRSLQDMAIGPQGCGLEQGARCLWSTGGCNE
ncbi:MAG TPA: STAS domain-containing protein [Deltaproteobacteria bacterium]|nr:STAS domain-containing protein [Deltaproteobacteria bacterium]HPR54341.1 STAS domain-containing protein [Deltaproteobacteria bacterium]HXK47020.1 STAS domain-containing protein [Deltaproteobacteria bacterium]